ACLILSSSSLLAPSFFFTPPSTTVLYTLSLHDALPISRRSRGPHRGPAFRRAPFAGLATRAAGFGDCLDGRRHDGGNPPSWRRRSEEHTSELQSRENLVCRLLLEKKKNIIEHQLTSIHL